MTPAVVFVGENGGVQGEMGFWESRFKIRRSIADIKEQTGKDACEEQYNSKDAVPMDKRRWLPASQRPFFGMDRPRM